MAQRVAGPDGSAGSTQVFVDDSGRRRRWARLAGAGVTALCMTYTAVVVVGLSQTAVGPLISVPTNGNGRVAGFPDTSGVVPGLLATGGTGGARTSHRTPAPTVRARDTAAVDTARAGRAQGSPVPVPDTRLSAKGVVPAHREPQPSHGPASPVDSGRSRATLTTAAA